MPPASNDFPNPTEPKDRHDGADRGAERWAFAAANAATAAHGEVVEVKKVVDALSQYVHRTMRYMVIGTVMAMVWSVLLGALVEFLVLRGVQGYLIGNELHLQDTASRR